MRRKEPSHGNIGDSRDFALGRKRCQPAQGTSLEKKARQKKEKRRCRPKSSLRRPEGSFRGRGFSKRKGMPRGVDTTPDLKKVAPKIPALSREI